MIGSHTILVGDVRAMLATLPDDHFHCVVTSPPYWALRDYGVDGQLGSEKTPEEYIETMVAVFREVRRVLRPDGVCWVNLGDSYARSGGEQGGGDRELIHMEGKQKRMCSIPDGSGLKPTKDLVGIPWRFALAAQADGWWLRSDVIWHKPNPMPESVTDRPTKAHEYLFLLTKRASYFYDAEAVKESAISEDEKKFTDGGRDKQRGHSRRHAGFNGRYAARIAENGVPTNRNLRDVWTVATEPYKGSHFATYPKKLIIPCIKAGTSEKGCCAKCGAPWERKVEKERVATRPGEKTKLSVDRRDGSDIPLVGKPWSSEEVGNRDPKRHVTTTVTTGWQTACKCEADIVPCRVLDPFLGSGTTAVVACNLWRDCVGIELNPAYAKLARRRIGKETRPGSWCDQSEIEPGGLFSEAPEILLVNGAIEE